MKTLDPEFKGVVMDFQIQILISNAQTFKSFTLEICEERFALTQGVFHARKNFFLLNKFNEVIERMKSNGIISHLVKSKLGGKSSKYHKGPSVLTVYNFLGTFQVLLFGLLVSAFGFVMELLAHHSKPKYFLKHEIHKKVRKRLHM
jgi:hypothetical protein